MICTILKYTVTKMKNRGLKSMIVIIYLENVLLNYVFQKI